jgi:hypothetical protein
MKSRLLISIILIVIPCSDLWSWGFFAHKRINRLAVFTLPDAMMGFYKANIEFITEHAVDPDKRRYSDKQEATRHYLDADHYEASLPFDSLPRRWNEAVAKYSEDTLLSYGIVPWHVNLMILRLTEAFRQRSKWKILRLSADIGHYIADAHVPLHSTENYNGQKTNQVGIHGLWESRLPELYSEQYDFFTGPALYLYEPQEAIWEAFTASHAALDSVLDFERELSAGFGQDRKYSFEQRGQNVVRNYSEDYSRRYHEMLNGMVERRFRASVLMVGSVWYTAWVNAGQPDLSLLDAVAPDQELAGDSTALEQKVKEGVIIGRPEE